MTRACMHADDDQSHSSASDLLSELETCSAQLLQLCGDAHDDPDQQEREEKVSAASIADECLALLSQLDVEEDDREAHYGRNDSNPPVTHSTAPSTEPALLLELNTLAGELQELMEALSGSGGLDEDCMTLEKESSPPDSREEAVDERPLSPLTSPKMKAFTARLERRQATKPHATTRRVFPPINRTQKAIKQEAKTSPVRRLLSDAAFWRQYQSKSFGQHITRQSTARKIQETAQQRHAKAIEYHYRRVSTSKYTDLLQAKTVAPAPVHPLSLPVEPSCTKSYLKRYTETHAGSDRQVPITEQAIEDGVLCGVYLYGKRHKGMLYLSCTSMEQLKTHIQVKFVLAEPVGHLYRELVAGNRKYLQRVSGFEELERGDLLCATTHGSQDIAILCSWMKRRQKVTQALAERKTTVTHSRKNVKTEVEIKQQKEKKKPQANDTAADTLKHVPSATPATKLWDENGRLLSVAKRLPMCDSFDI